MQGFSPLNADRLGENVSGWPERRLARGVCDKRYNKKGTNGSAMCGRHPGKSREWKRLQLARGMQQAVLGVAKAVTVVIVRVTMLKIARMIDGG